MSRDRPQYAVFPEDEQGFAIDDQYYIGDSGLLFKPVTQEGAETTEVYISDNQVSLRLSSVGYVHIEFLYMSSTMRTG